MTLRRMYGFNDITAAALPPEIAGGGSVTVAALRSGAAGFSVSSTATTVALGVSVGTVYVGLATMCQTAHAANNNSFNFREGATVHCGVGINISGYPVVYGPAGTVVATGTVAAPAAAFFYLEIKAIIADVGGVVEVKIDGVVSVTYTGDTRNAGTGVCDTFSWRSWGSGNCFLDDVYILDSAGSAPYNTYLGDIVVRTILPNGNGASSDWLGSDGNSTDNYLLVDDPSTTTADYVTATATGKTDLYLMGDIPTTDLPLAIQVVVYADKSDGGTPPVFKMVTKGDGGTVLEESAVTLSTTWQTFAGAIRTLDPDGDALTATNVNGMQSGVRTA